jgi:PPK2 family polyphosphate:nucleotide phosphotransferase
VPLIPASIRRCLRVRPGKEVDLADFTTTWEVTPGLKDAGKELAKRRAKHLLEQSLEPLTDVQTRLYATGKRAVQIVFQAIDAAGKDGTIKHVMSGVNPQGCSVSSFKVPTPEERAHNFLWRYSKALPERGKIGIFNRSYYEDVLVVKVHPELLGGEPGDPGKKFWKRRYKDITAFEKHLVRNGTVILKFFLHVSKDEQKRRFLERLDEPAKNWKFSPSDLAERGYWDAYQRAYADCLAATSTRWAPWYVIPADQKWATRALVAGIVTDAIGKLDLKVPEPTAERRAELEEARKKLMAE